MPADKKLGLVVLDREWYVQEGNRQLSDKVVYNKQVDSVPPRQATQPTEVHLPNNTKQQI